MRISYIDKRDDDEIVTGALCCWPGPSSSAVRLSTKSSQKPFSFFRFLFFDFFLSGAGLNILSSLFGDGPCY
jgi:hypothetical protein